MKSTFQQTLAFALFLLLAGCAAINHNIPQANPLTAGAPADRITIYADANGHLYPHDWRGRFNEKSVERQHSLLAARKFDPAVNLELDAERERQLRDAAAKLRDRSRIFILVHGFNNNHAEARHAFDVVRSRLPLSPDDGVVEFHWDGLSSLSDVGRGSMWFNAAGYSQLAGTQALRGLLRRLDRAPVYIIAHSRGASVTLSALSDPAYNRRFRARTHALLMRAGADVFSVEPLPDEGSPIHVLLLAPAIGNPDFRESATNRETPARACRLFPGRLQSIHYSVNPEDPVLKKPLSLAAHFNATDLGFDKRVGEALKSCYEKRGATFRMSGHELSMPQHSFIDYAQNAVFLRMLAAALGGAP